MEIQEKPIKQFLDSVDIVLNSNTFIVEFEIVNNNLEQSLYEFLLSENFIGQLAQQDIQRDWHNLHYYDNKAYCFKIKSGNLLEKNFELKINTPLFDKKEYLTAMLTGDTGKGSFFSFYGNEMDRHKAEIIIDNLTDYLSAYTGEWDLFTVQPDFLKCTSKNYGRGEDLKYFEGDYGNDTATIIKYKNTGFLILTNGID